MKVSQIIRTIKTQPEVWVKAEENEYVFVFEYQGYEFLKLSKELGGAIKLINTSNNTNMVWEETDKVGSQLWSYVMKHYVKTQILNK